MTNQPAAAGLRIGITIGLQHPAESLWTNGIKQNAVFLAEALRHCPNVRSVQLVNTTAVALTDALPWDRQRWPTIPFDEARDHVDILIELGGQIDAGQTAHLKQRGARLVSYCCGSEYVQSMECVLFGKPGFGANLFVNQRYDDIWMVPQVAHLNQSYYTTLRRRTAQVVPFVWDPVLLQSRSQGLPALGEYRPRAGPRRLSVMEPNINVVKFCLYPILIAEEAFRRHPELVSFLHVTNADRLANQSPEFVALMNQLDIVRQGKAAFVGRYDTPQFLSEFSDVVVSHQWENPLNYFYLEVCWQGYALVHNAPMCADLGYYYPDHDVASGAAALLRALRGHDDASDEYRARQRQAIGRFLPGDAAVTARYTHLLADLMARPIA